MSLSTRLTSWFRAMTGRKRLEQDIEAELRFHIESRTADLIREGLVPQEAARRARVEFGGVETHKDSMRASLGLRGWDIFWADLRYAARVFRRSPGFTAMAVTSLALAIGANTAIFSLARQLLYERLDVLQAEQLRLLAWSGNDNVAVHNAWGDFSEDGGRVSSSVFPFPIYQQLRAHNHDLQDLFAFKFVSMNGTLNGNAMRITAEMVSGNYYGQLGVKPQLGRPILQADDGVPGTGTVAVISDGLWQRVFGRSPKVLGQTITLNQAVLTIVGVNPRGFTGAQSVQQSPDVFLPLSMQPLVKPMNNLNPANPGGTLLGDPETWWINIMGRVRPGVPDKQAQAALNVELSAAVHATGKIKASETMPAMDLRDGSRGLFETQRQFAKPMTVLMIFTCLVLFLACANIANLLLARGAQRQREMSVRLALGAGRVRVLRQMLTESLLLAAVGGVIGLLLGYLGSNLLPKMLYNAWEGEEIQVHLSWEVFVFTAAVTLLTGLLFGLAPAWAATRVDANSGLKETTKAATRRRKGWSGRVLVVVQVALSMLLVVGAGLFLRTLVSLNSVDAGFRTDHLLLFDINPPARSYPEGKDVALHQRLEQAFAALPGVESVTLAEVPYIANSQSGTDFLPEGETFDKKQQQHAVLNVVGNSFFRTMGIPILAGRSFGPQDTATSQKVAIISASLARTRFPGVNPVGKRFSTSGDSKKRKWIQIVGICADTRYSKLRDEPPAQYILPYVQQDGAGYMTYEIRTQRKPEEIVPSLRDVVQRIDRDLPITSVRTQQEQIDDTMQQERIFVVLTSSFGILALVLAAVGIYGIMAYSVANRTHEIGIRMALGAQPGQVRAMILRESTWITGIGIAAGLGAAFLLARLIRTMLYGVTSNDPVTLAAGALVLIGIALAAAWIPARRASRIEPMEALRHE